jgi:capsular exopolysaccharide synthesis family protein
MSRLFEALSGLKKEQRATDVVAPHAEAPPAVVPLPPKQEAKPEHHSLKVVQPTVGPLALVHAEPVQKVEEGNKAVQKMAEPVETPGILVCPSPMSHLVAWTDPNCLGAEKFRALATRFDHLRTQRELRSFQVTSSVIDEGKTLVAGNIAVTLAKYSGSKTLLVEGDLHRPTLANIFGLSELRGLNHWWTGGEPELGKFIHRLNGIPLWFLAAGKPFDQPSDMLRSDRFQKAFRNLAGQFEWIVVDSTPMLPIVDVNLWSRLLDGTLLVVREGVAPVKALKRGLQALDHPKLIGVVVNEAMEMNQAGYAGQYYGGYGRGDKSAKKKS